MARHRGRSPASTRRDRTLLLGVQGFGAWETCDHPRLRRSERGDDFGGRLEETLCGAGDPRALTLVQKALCRPEGRHSDWLRSWFTCLALRSDRKCRGVLLRAGSVSKSECICRT